MEMRKTTNIKPDPDNPRKQFDAALLKGMASTLKEHGIQNPLHVDENGVLIAGERRWRAAQIAKLQEVPVIVHKNLTPTQRLEIQCLEELEIQKENWNFIERAEAWERLRQSYEQDGIKVTNSLLSKKLGVATTTIVRALHCLKYPDEVKEYLKTKKISERVATHIMDNAKLRLETKLKLMRRAADEGMGRSEAFRMVRRTVQDLELTKFKKAKQIPEDFVSEIGNKILDLEGRLNFLYQNASLFSPSQQIRMYQKTKILNHHQRPRQWGRTSRVAQAGNRKCREPDF
mgnify:CR=1 FL=1